MLCFSWVEIDWVKWMPVEVLVLFIMIFLIRILRRTYRWKNIEVSHTSQFKKTTPFGEFTVYNQQDVNLSKLNLNSNFEDYSIEIEAFPLKTENRILYIPGLSGFSRRSNFVQQSLSLLGYEVIEVTPKQFYKLALSFKKDPTAFSTFLLQENIKTIIGFDYSTSIFLSLIQEHKNNSDFSRVLKNIRWIFIRPLFSWEKINNRFLFFPFTIGWFNLIFLKNYIRKLLRTHLIGKKFSQSDLMKNIYFFKKLNIIIPRKFHLSQAQKEIVNFLANSYVKKEFVNFTYFEFQKGDWDFYQNETVLLGLLSDILLN